MIYDIHACMYLCTWKCVICSTDVYTINYGKSNGVTKR